MLCIKSLSFHLSTTRMVLLHLYIKSTGLLSAIRWFNRDETRNLHRLLFCGQRETQRVSEWLVLDHAITEALVIGLA